MNLQALLNLDQYLTKSQRINLTIAQLAILLSLRESPKSSEEIAEAIGRSLNHTREILRPLKLPRSTNKQAIGFTHKVANTKYHLTEAGRAWIEELLK